MQENQEIEALTMKLEKKVKGFVQKVNRLHKEVTERPLWSTI